MHMFIHTLSFISGGDSPEGPAKEYCKKYAAPDCILMHHTFFQYFYSYCLPVASYAGSLKRTQNRCELN